MKAGRIFAPGLSWLVVMVWATVALAQAPDTLWTRRYAGLGDDRAYCIRQTFDQGYIIAGSSYSFGSGTTHCWLVKIDADGDTLWTRTYGSSECDEAFSVVQYADSGYVFVGYSRITPTGYEFIHAVRVNSVGDTVWSKYYQHGIDPYPGAPWDYRDNRGYSVISSGDGGFVLTGFTKWLLYSWPGWPPDIYVQMTLEKLNFNGETVWLRFHGEMYPDFPQSSGYSLRKTSDGGYIVAGRYDNVSRLVMWLLKANSLGFLEWSCLYCGEGGIAHDVQLAGDGGYVLAGLCRYHWGGPYYCLLKIDSTGAEEWHAAYDMVSTAYSVSVLPDGGYLVTGAGNGVLPLVRTNTTGDTLWTKDIGPAGQGTDGRSVIVSSDGSIVVAGYCNAVSGGGKDFYVVKLSSETSAIQPNRQGVVPNSFALRAPYPNPFNPATTTAYDVPVQGNVKLNVYNIMGQELATLADGPASPGSYSVTWDARDLPSGIYFVRMEAGEFVQTRKVVLLK